MTVQTGNNGTKDVAIMVPLKYLSNIWRILAMPFISSEITLGLNCAKNCVIVATAVPNQEATFSVTDIKRSSSCNFINSR